MILQQGPMSSNQGSALERMGRELHSQSTGHAPLMGTAPESAVAFARHQLYLLDRSEHRMSIEDLAETLLQNPKQPD